MNRMGGKQKKSVMLTYLCERLGVFFVFWVRTSWQFQYVNVSFVLFKKKKKKTGESRARRACLQSVETTDKDTYSVLPHRYYRSSKTLGKGTSKRRPCRRHHLHES